MRVQILIAGFALPLLFGALPIAGRAAANEEAKADWTTREFAARCSRAADSLDPYVGGGQLRALLGQIEAIASEGATVRQAPAALRMNTAYQATLQGNQDLAIELLEGLRQDLAQFAPQARQMSDVLQMKAINHLLRAEDLNCIAEQRGASCILPIDPANAHLRREDARQARDLYRELIERNQGESRPQWLWLLNLSHAFAGAEMPLPQELDFSHRLWSAAEIARPWVNVAPRLGLDGMDLSGGAVLDDFDGDGRLDVVTSSWHPCSSLRAYRQLPAGGFEDVTERWNLHRQLGGLNLRQADYDNDGRLDLLVLRGAWRGEQGRIRNSLLRNTLEEESASSQNARGGLRFVDTTYEAGLALPAYPTQTAAWADYDGDGDLDLYVGNEGAELAIDPVQVLAGNARAYPSQLFRNDGDGTFTETGLKAGVANQRFAKGVAWGDYDGDGDPDLFVSNLGRNRLYENRGDATFSDVAAQVGVDADGRTFGTWWFDFDNDGDLDLFVASYGASPDLVAAAALGGRSEGQLPLLYLNQRGADGAVRFEQVGVRMGFDRPLLVMGSSYGDLDQDGFADLYLGTGSPIFDSLMPNIALRNREGTGFEEVGGALGLAHLQKGHGVAFGDVDGDGDEDLLHQLGGAYAFDAYGNALFLNPSQRDWIVLRLVGVKANRFGVGARVAVKVKPCRGPGEAPSSWRTVYQTVDGGGSFGGNSLQLEVGLADACSAADIEVLWPGSGTVDRVEGVELGSTYELVEGSGELRLLEAVAVNLLRAPQLSDPDAAEHPHAQHREPRGGRR